MSDLPSIVDWEAVSSDLDELDAREVFFGKTLDEVRRLLIENFDMRCLDLRYIPVVPFEYYSLAFLEFLLSDDCDDDHFDIWFDLFMSTVRDRERSCEGFERDFWRRNSSFLNPLEARVMRSTEEDDFKAELLRGIGLMRDG